MPATVAPFVATSAAAAAVSKMDVLLPHENRDILYMFDSGAETTFIFHENIPLRDFAGFELLYSDKGIKILDSYFRRHLDIAVAASNRGQKVGFVLEAQTWRANPDWIDKLGYTKDDDLQDISSRAVEGLRKLQREYESKIPIVVSGIVGPRSDGYVANMLMSPEEAKTYHQVQIDTLAVAGVDMVSAYTLNYVNEAIGIARAAKQAGLPVTLAFTVETNGRLATGESLKEAIERIDAATEGYVAYYVINCAHPTHFVPNALKAEEDTAWRLRIGGIRANASKLSHAELDEAEELDDGNPKELAAEYRNFLPLLPNANAFGGCCGTDHRHVSEICAACAPVFGKKE